MRVAVLNAPRQLELVEQRQPEPGPGEVLVRAASCGVCASELDMWREDVGVEYPRFPGHEVSGTVERVGPGVAGPRAADGAGDGRRGDPGASLRPGDAVAVWVTGRGFADYAIVRAEHCLPAGDVPLEPALAEPLACALNAVELAAPALGDDVVIIGAGFMGNLVQKVAQLKGPRAVIVADTGVWTVVARMVVDAERGRPAQAPHRHQLLGRARPHAPAAPPVRNSYSPY